MKNKKKQSKTILSQTRILIADIKGRKIIEGEYSFYNILPVVKEE